MSKSRPRKEDSPGGKISVGPEERAEIQRVREERGLNQRELGRKIGVSQGTISNLESGRHPQINLVAYTKLRRWLAVPESKPNASEIMKPLVTNLTALDESQLQFVNTLVEQLIASKKP